MEQYIGSAKVIDNVLENGLVQYKLDNGLTLTATQDQFVSMISPAPYDDGQISIKKWATTIAAIIQLAVDNNATVQDFEWIQDRTAEVLQKNYMSAMAKAFKVDFPKQATLKQIDEILKSV